MCFLQQMPMIICQMLQTHTFRRRSLIFRINVSRYLIRTKIIEAATAVNTAATVQQHPAMLVAQTSEECQVGLKSWECPMPADWRSQKTIFSKREGAQTTVWWNNFVPVTDGEFGWTTTELESRSRGRGSLARRHIRCLGNCPGDARKWPPAGAGAGSVELCKAEGACGVAFCAAATEQNRRGRSSLALVADRSLVETWSAVPRLWKFRNFRRTADQQWAHLLLSLMFPSKPRFVAAWCSCVYTRRSLRDSSLIRPSSFASTSKLMVHSWTWQRTRLALLELPRLQSNVASAWNQTFLRKVWVVKLHNYYRLVSLVVQCKTLANCFTHKKFPNRCSSQAVVEVSVPCCRSYWDSDNPDTETTWPPDRLQTIWLFRSIVPHSSTVQTLE